MTAGDSGQAGVEGRSTDGPASERGRSWSDDEELALRLWISLARCYGTLSREVAAKVAEYGLTTPQFGILEALYHLGPLSLGDLANKLLVTGGNVTYIMDRLEEQGLVIRDRSSADRRIVRARLTSDGEVLIRNCFPGHASFIAEMAAHLDADEQTELRRLLKKWGKGMSEAVEG